jgi:hypothetical protein
MFMVTNFFTVFITFYGMLGLWSEKVGYHRLYDFWFYNILFGLFQAPYYAVSSLPPIVVNPTVRTYHLQNLTVCPNNDERSNPARLRELLLRPIRNYQSSGSFSYPILTASPQFFGRLLTPPFLVFDYRPKRSTSHHKQNKQ